MCILSILVPTGKSVPREVNSKNCTSKNYSAFDQKAATEGHRQENLLEKPQGLKEWRHMRQDAVYQQ